MKFEKDTRLDELKQIEHLLYGNNYDVWFNIYGPINADFSLTEAVKLLISKNCDIFRCAQTTSIDALSEIMDMIFYEGDASAGPINLESKKSEITNLLNKAIRSIDIENAEKIVKFEFKSGHPAYPVFWDFAFDIQSKGQRWMFIDSSND